MKKVIQAICFYFLSINYVLGNTFSETEKFKSGKDLLLREEKHVAALSFFSSELKIASCTNNKEEVAECMVWIAECLFQMRRLKELDLVIKLSEEYIKKEELDNMYRNLMLTKSKYLIDLGKNTEAINILLKTENKGNTKYFIFENKLILADAYYRIGKLEESKLIFDFIINQTSDTIQKAQAFNGKGSCFFMKSEFDSASICYNKALDLDIKNSSSILYNVCLIDIKFGDYSKSDDKMIKVLNNSIRKYGNQHPKTAELYGVIASLLLVEDNIDISFYYSIKEKKILQELYGIEHEKNIYPYLNLAKIYIIQKKYELAEVELINALNLTKKHYNKKHNLYSQCIIKLAELYIEQKKYKTADSLLFEVVNIKKYNPDDFTPDLFLQLGLSFSAQKKYDDAISYFKKSNEMYVNFFGEKNVYAIDPLTELSKTFLLKNNFSEALNYAYLALYQTIDSNKIIFPYDHWECVLQILKCKKEMYDHNLIKNENYKNDIELIKNTIIEAAKIKQTYYSNGSQMHYAEKMSELNILGIYFLTHFYKKTDPYFIDNLLYFSEYNKANLLRYKISSSVANQLLPEIEKNKIGTITDKLNYFISLNENQEQQGFNINDSILFYQNEHEILIKKIEQKYPKVYSIKYGQKPINAHQVQEKIKKNYSFLIYFNDGENYYCLNISKQKINYKICGKKQKIDSVLENYQAKLLNKKLDKKTNQLLSSMLLPKNLNNNIIISSDENIQKISFDALYKNNTNEYLIYNHAIQYAFSVSTYFIHPNATKNKNIFGFFPSFNNSNYATLDVSTEIKSLQNLPNFISFSDSFATKKSFLKNYKNASIIHIASHLITDSISPMESSVLFQDSKNNKLTINEIWKLNSNMQLVSLATCHSNFGKQQTGEGNQNFAWAFHYAGAHHILSTQWNAADKSTTSIVGQFFNNLDNKKSIQKSLQLAKINYLKNTDAIGAQPFYWANYCLYADETEVYVGGIFSIIFFRNLVIAIFSSLISYRFYKILTLKKTNFAVC